MEGKKPKVLLCEDDTNLGSVLKNYLELNDYDVILERDGRLGLAAFQREKFDICQCKAIHIGHHYIQQADVKFFTLKSG